MARKKVASLKKRLKSKPMAYVDKKGNVRHFSSGRKSSLLQRNVVSKALLKLRKAKGKKGILLFVKGKSVFQTARKLRRKRRKSRTKRKVRRKSRAKRKVRRKSRAKRKTRKTRKSARKGKRKAKRKVRRARKSKKRKSKRSRRSRRR